MWGQGSTTRGQAVAPGQMNENAALQNKGHMPAGPVETRLTACSKPGSLTVLHRGVNVSALHGSPPCQSTQRASPNGFMRPYLLVTALVLTACADHGDAA